MSDGANTISDHIESGRRVLAIEADAVRELADQLESSFGEAVERVLETAGRVVVCGMGKSGIVGHKISATLASTGTPSLYLHPAEAFHGDLGMVTGQDAFLAISNSGETEELIRLLPFLRSNGNVLIAMTGNPQSTLAQAAHIHLNVPVRMEACPLRLAPTTSTTATLAMGDALAVALMEARDFRPEQFARFHPGGSLGRRLLSRVEDIMLREDLPVVSEDDTVMDILAAITKSKVGVAAVRTSAAWAVVTDGDIRRGIESFGESIFERRASELMTIAPVTVSSNLRAEDAFLLMERRNIAAVLVVDHGEFVGILTR